MKALRNYYRNYGSFLWGERKAVDGCHVAQNDVTHAALGQAGVKTHVLLADHAVLLVAGGLESDVVYRKRNAQTILL